MIYRTRIAPSPTGMFHLGTARTAYFNWLAARASGGRFILRIDDTDTDRNDPAAVQVILDSMAWLGLDYDEIYYQSDRLDLYRSAAADMIGVNQARVLDNGAVALNIPDLPDSFPDTLAGSVKISDDAKQKMEPLILFRGDDKGNGPTYQFASIFDDYIMGVNWIIRGTDHIQNTPKQLAIWQAAFLGTFPQVSHVGLIHKDGKKLSKRDDAASLLWYRDQGYHPGAILSFLIRMGWAPRIDDKSMRVVTLDMALKLFLAGGSMRNSSANYQQDRLDFLQAHYEGKLGIPNEQRVPRRARPAG